LFRRRKESGSIIENEEKNLKQKVSYYSLANHWVQ
jgi:hypothetical protein